MLKSELSNKRTLLPRKRKMPKTKGQNEMLLKLFKICGYFLGIILKVYMRPLPMHRFHPHLQRSLPVSADLLNVRISLNCHTFGHQLNSIFQTFPIQAASLQPYTSQMLLFSTHKHRCGTTEIKNSINFQS